LSCISIEFSENFLRVLKINDSREIIFKDEIGLGFNINDILNFKKSRNEITSLFSEKINETKIFENSEDYSVCVLMETSQIFLNVFPVDFHEDKNNINSHILWELSNYYPETYKDFIIKYYRLNNNYLNEYIDEVLLIAIDKNKFDIMQSLCNGNGIKIKNIDIDQFASEKCIKEIYSEEFKSKNILLIGNKNNRLDFSLIANEKIKYYDFSNTNKHNQKSVALQQINYFQNIFIEINFDRIFLYGDESTIELMNFINEEKNNYNVKLLNPVNEGDNSVNNSIYAPLYGLALKNLQ